MNEDATHIAPHLQQVLGGKPGAARELVARLRPVIRRRVARALLRGGCGGALGFEIEDLTQDVLLRLFENQGRVLKAWRPERGLSLEQFIGMIARRHALSILRRRRLQPFKIEPTDPAELEDLAPPSARRADPGLSHAQETLLRVTAALRQRLSRAGLEMFRRIFIEQQSVRDISAATGLSADAVYQWRARIRRAARRHAVNPDCFRANASRACIRIRKQRLAREPRRGA